ncbi:putative ankyrin repeat protein RF_0381 [Haliotis cracherodii]|uniref:putative ankyrin repeat protein RF_0381 n=1 Tax=Haliotis cracherodii TaxID=6455 RepID=UPI0039E9AF78
MSERSKCQPGMFGRLCDQLCPKKCARKKGRKLVDCDRDSGSCSEGCVGGWYGDQCDQTCSKNCKDNICNQVNGQCTRGCKAKYRGKFCESFVENWTKPDGVKTDSESNVAPSIAAVVIILSICIVAIVIYIKKRNRRRQRAGSETLQRDTELHEACRTGDLHTVKGILSDSRVPINSRGIFGRTPIMVASENGHSELVNLLVEQISCDLSLTDDDGDNILHRACYGGHLEIVEKVLSENCVDINSSGRRGRTPVMMAAWGGQMNTFSLLVHKGASLELLDEGRDNILYWACAGGNWKIVRYILSKDIININCRGWSGMTPSMMAAWKGQTNVLEFLVNRGCDMLQRDDHNKNLLHWVCYGGHLDTDNYVLSKNLGDINSAGLRGMTPVMVAAREGHIKVLDLLLKKGSDVSQKDSEGNTILHMACIGGHEDMVKHIFANKLVDINLQNNMGSTAAMIARTEGHNALYDLFVSRGYNLE